MHHGQVQWTKIFVEREVRQIVVNIEEEGVLVVLRRAGTGDPVKLVYKSGQQKIRYHEGSVGCEIGIGGIPHQYCV